MRKHSPITVAIASLGVAALASCLSLASRPSDTSIFMYNDSGDTGEPSCMVQIGAGLQGSDVGTNTSWPDRCHGVVCGSVTPGASDEQDLAWFNFRVEHAGEGMWFIDGQVVDGASGDQVSIDIRESNSQLDSPPPASASVGSTGVVLDASKTYAVVISAVSGAEPLQFRVEIDKSTIGTGGYCEDWYSYR